MGVVGITPRRPGVQLQLYAQDYPPKNYSGDHMVQIFKPGIAKQAICKARA